MDYAIAFDPIVHFAFWSGVAVIVLTGLMTVQIFIMRVLWLIRERRNARLTAAWRPLLAGASGHAPRVSNAEAVYVLTLWNRLHTSLRGAAKERLNALARLAGLDNIALRFLHRRHIRKRLLAVKTLGQLRATAAWDTLLRYSADPHPVLSLAAAHALLQIDAARALPIIVPLIAARRDWALNQVAMMLREADQAQLVAALMQTPSAHDRAGLIRYLTAIRTELGSALLDALLRGAPEEDIILACLPALKDPKHAEYARLYARHADWRIRVQAAAALGKLGVPGDEQTLVELLSDRHWQVRQRAAQALAALPFVSAAALRRIQATLTDRYARESLTPFTDVSAHALDRQKQIP